MFKELRKFGLVVGSIFLIISLRLTILTPVAIILLSLGLIKPVLLKYPYLAWMSLSLIMGKISTTVILTFTFVFLIIPLSLTLKILKKDLLKLKTNKQQSSYWISINNDIQDKNSYEKQY